MYFDLLWHIAEDMSDLLQSTHGYTRWCVSVASVTDTAILIEETWVHTCMYKDKTVTTHV